MAILGSIDGSHVWNHQNNAAYVYIYVRVCVSVYLPVEVNERMSLKQSTFYDVENSTPLVGLEPTISITYRVINIRNVSAHRTMHLKFISTYQWLQTKQLNAKITKIWLQMSDDDNHFEFYDLWGKGAIYSLA